jgi:ribosomal protein S18 acetylase RimI-like enzyme
MTRLELISESTKPLRDALLDVYSAAFSQPPYSEAEADAARFLDSLVRHGEREGFRCVVARAAEHIVGFAYGYTSRAGQWWHDLIAQALHAQDADAGWLDGAFELVTLAVHPEMQGHGIGGALHDAVLRDLPNRAAALSVREEAPALHLYRARGWQPVLTRFQYPGGTHPCTIMRRELP